MTDEHDQIVWVRQEALNMLKAKLEAAEELADAVAVYFQPSTTFPSSRGMCLALAKYQEATKPTL